MPSLSDLGVMDHMSRSDDDMDDSSSTCSYYSLSDVEDMSFRKIPAHEVRKQSEQVPEFNHLSTYPHTFRNSEALPLKVAGPWLEYPLCLKGSYRQSMGMGPGPARVIINPSVPGGYDVIYHPTKLEGRFLQARYRPKGYRAKISGCTAMPTIPSPPSSPLLSSSLPISPFSLLSFSPPASPGFYGASHGLTQMTFQQAFALAAQQQYVAWQQQSMMASCMYPQVMGYNGVVRGQSLLEY
ncbi:extracellular guanyl-specific ribonuclease Fl2 [Fusarium pseudocircinatum]|uniref:Extracellular guanyl-specific ribonuclease Fl2 n=1 Tax=Fusarium pseudocircinatum TaxID=56676 RepID=A0A8H5PCR1_9HYPO|nr:extracellular guanyl-specific ribonuclease Fl2 [Fusarium pseudocircinatum]